MTIKTVQHGDDQVAAISLREYKIHMGLDLRGSENLLIELAGLRVGLASN